MASFLTTRFLRPVAHAAMGVALAALLTGCEQRELCYDHNHAANVRVDFDWFFARNAEVESMTVLFYNDDDPSAEPIRYDLAGRNGGMVKLQPGKWTAVAYNNDTETILFRGQSSPSTLEAYTRESSVEEGTQIFTRGDAMPRAARTEEESVILEPDMLYGALGDPLILRPEDTNTTLTLQPEARVTEVDITIHDVPNLEYAGQFGGALSGLAPSVLCHRSLHLSGHQQDNTPDEVPHLRPLPRGHPEPPSVDDLRYSVRRYEVVLHRRHHHAAA